MSERDWNPYAGSAPYRIDVPATSDTKGWPGKSEPVPDPTVCRYCGKTYKFRSGKERHEQFFCREAP